VTDARSHDDVEAGARGTPGQAIVTASWVTTIAFAVTAVPAAFGVDAFDDAAVWTAVGLFVIAVPIWLYAFVVGVGRSRRDLVTIPGLFFLHGSAPAVERRLLMGSWAATLIITAATASAEPFGVLVPVLPLAFAGLWAARHGTFAERPEPPPRSHPGGASRNAAR